MVVFRCAHIYRGASKNSNDVEDESEEKEANLFAGAFLGSFEKPTKTDIAAMSRAGTDDNCPPLVLPVAPGL